MNKILTADKIYSPESWLENHVLCVADDGTITDLRPIQIGDNPEYLGGILCPGFVNAHCHLELSGLKGKIAKGIGMAGFGADVVSKRQEISDLEAEKSIENALQFAWDTGTNVIGDICNDASSLAPKQRFDKLYVHNFIEIFALREEMADFVWEKGKNLLKQFPAENSTLTLHAPYSASEKLLAIAGDYFHQNPYLASVHLLESKDEREIFEKGTGYFANFFQKLGIHFHGFSTKSPINYIAKGLDTRQTIVFVHLTEASAAELAFLATQFPNSFFCLCPVSNLYIHNTFPNLPLLLPYKDRICLGTDSLASNDSLAMYKEIQAITTRFPEIDFHTLIYWLTTGGAKALQVSEQYGTFAVGKKPGVLNLVGDKVSRIY